MKRILVDLSTFTLATKVFLDDGESQNMVQVSGRLPLEFLQIAKEYKADEIVLLGPESYTIQTKKELDNLLKIEYNNIEDKKIKIILGGNI